MSWKKVRGFLYLRRTLDHCWPLPEAPAHSATLIVVRAIGRFAAIPASARRNPNVLNSEIMRPQRYKRWASADAIVAVQASRYFAMWRFAKFFAIASKTPSSWLALVTLKNMSLLDAHCCNSDAFPSMTRTV